MKIDRLKIAKLDCILAPPPSGNPPKVVVILCHGFGAPGHDLVSLGMELSRSDLGTDQGLFVFPAAPLELDPTFDGRAWWMIDVGRLQYLMAIGETRQMRNVHPPELPACRRQIFEIIEWAKSKYGLPSDKIIVGGFSQGAMLMTDVALNYSDPLGGLIVWSGALICEEDWKNSAEKQAPLKIVQTHGSEDMILSLEGALDLRAMLQQAGHQVHFFEFEGPHTIPMEGINLAAELIAERCQ
jgi:phospholipase/carboxylesterase